MLVQDLCKRKFDWDDPIPQEDLTRWQAWMSELPKLEHFRVERCFKPRGFGEVESCQLHLFSDASEVAYGAATYLRMVSSSGDVHCSFVMGKARLSPLKPVTIPRMELSTAVLSTRSDRMIQEEIEYRIDNSVFWTDSTCVTLCGERRKEIRNLRGQPCICDTRAIPAKTVALRPDRAQSCR